jgi:DNA-binding NarL/FixJ family response regulator
MRVALVDDEPYTVQYLSERLVSTFGSDVEVVTLDRPRRLGVDVQFDAAVVDLSFGLQDLDADHFALELETGVDAIDHLRLHHPSCRIVVASRVDYPLVIESAKAIRQTWPDIRMLHKADIRWHERAVQFIQSGDARDNTDVELILAGVTKLDPSEIAASLNQSTQRGRLPDMLLTLANSVEMPSRVQLAERLGIGDDHTRNLLTEIGSCFKSAGILPGGSPVGIERLWPWARARRPILRRLFPSARH